MEVAVFGPGMSFQRVNHEVSLVERRRSQNIESC